MKRVDAHDVLKALRRHFLKWASLPDTCIQNKYANVVSLKLFADRSLVVLDLSHFEEIGYNVLFLHVSFDLLQPSFHLVFVASNHADIEALGRQFVADVKPIAI